MLTILRWLISKSGLLLLSFMTVVAVLALSRDLSSNWEFWKTRAENAEKQAVDAQKNAKNAKKLVQNFTARKSEFSKYASDTLKKADEEIATLKSSNDTQLTKAEKSISLRKLEARAHLLQPGDIAWAAATGKTDKIVASYKAQYIELPLLERTAEFVKISRANQRSAESHAKDSKSLNMDIYKFNREVKIYNFDRMNNENRQKQAEKEWKNPLCKEVNFPIICDLVVNIKSKNEALMSKKSDLDDKKTNSNCVKQRRS
jgi:hypothetical protein